MSVSLLRSVTLPNNLSTSVTFSNIPATGKDLLLLVSGRTQANSFARLVIQANGSGSNYKSTYLNTTISSTTGGSTDSGEYLSFPAIQLIGTNGSSDIYSGGEVYITDYTLSSRLMAARAYGAAPNTTANAFQSIEAGYNNNSAPIQSLTISNDNAAVFQNGTVFSLYIVN